jgi:hypothetical protein
LATLLGFGCGSSGTPAGGGDGSAGSGGSGGSGGSSATFTEIYSTILNPTGGSGCVNQICHAAGFETQPAQGGLDMSTQTLAYMNLVNVKALGTLCAPSGDIRVVPGNPSTSLMYLKVSEATPPCGVQMPDMMLLSSLTPLTADQLQTISDWITAGAMP